MVGCLLPRCAGSHTGFFSPAFICLDLATHICVTIALRVFTAPYIRLEDHVVFYCIACDGNRSLKISRFHMSMADQGALIGDIALTWSAELYDHDARICWSSKWRHFFDDGYVLEGMCECLSPQN